MIGIPIHCLIEEPLSDALYWLLGLTDRIEVMDEGLHFAESPEIFGSYSADFTIHAPFHGLNIACVFEPILNSKYWGDNRLFCGSRRDRCPRCPPPWLFCVGK